MSAVLPVKNLSAHNRKSLDKSSATGVAVTDEQLVAWCVAGNREAFEHLVRRHQKGLVNHLCRLTGWKENALDLAQEVFIKVYLSLASFDPRYRFTTWLYRIASNSAIDYLRKKRPNTCSLSEGPEENGHLPSERNIAGPEPSPHEMLRYHETRTRIDRSVSELPPEYRELILLRHQRGCRYDEIARITGLPIGTVKNRIFRAREILRNRLSDVLGPEV